MAQTPGTEARTTSPDRWLMTLVLVVSMTVLAQEVALLRVLAIAHWHHAAQLIIAVALCGFGAAATALAIFSRLKSSRAAHRVAALYAVSIPVSLLAASELEFNALAVGWEPAQWLRLLALQAVFIASIVLAALSIQIGLALAGPRIGRTYAINLLGSGVGALAVLPLLNLGPPEQVLGWIAILPAALALPRARKSGLVALAAVLLAPPVTLEMTAYKTLPNARALPDASIVETRFRPHARIDLVRAPSLRPVSGLSLSSQLPVPAMTLITVDGSAAGAIVNGNAAFFHDTLAAAPLALMDSPRVLILGEAGNLHEAALGHQRVTRVDIAWTGRNPREYLAHTDQRFDIVWLRLPRSVAMAENALATREAFAAALGVTTEHGVVFISAPIHTPPREELKAINTALAVSSHVQAVRSLDRLGLLLRKRAFDADEIRALSDFCRQRGFDRIGDENRVHDAGHQDYLRALSGESVISRYRINPASDDSPFFHRFLAWRQLPDAVASTGALHAAHVDWGTLVAIIAAAQVTMLGALLLIMPLLTVYGRRSPARERRFALLHFVAIGCAYAAIEMAFLGRLTVLLGRPEYAFGIVLCAFLIASGIGSLTALPIRIGAWAASAIALVSLLALDWVQSIPAAIALAALVALPMGIPFPAGLRRLDRRASQLVPWALAANGCTSVAAFSAAPLLASDVGYSGLIVIGAMLYLIVGAADRRNVAINPP